jgi:transmembrane sensor
MSDPRGGKRLFRAWADTLPPLDEATGRTRFLEAAAAKTTARPGVRSGWWMAAAASLVLVVAVGALAGWERSRATLHFTAGTSDGHTGAWLATSPEHEMPLSFSEGTQLVIAADSRGRVEALGRAGASFLLERGEVRAKVVHRDGTDWRFLAGPFEVLVTGTSLRVSWDPSRERFAVRVDEGSIVLRGPDVQQTVRAGERCAVDVPTGTLRVTTTTPDALHAARLDGANDGTDAGDEATDAAPASGATGASPARSGSAAVPWTALEERGDYASAYRAATRDGFASVLRASTSDELLRLAEVAQLSGHPAAGREALLTCRSRFHGTEPSAVAAYELGRMASPGDASSWFEAYLHEAPSGPLAREALGRLVEARAASNDPVAARSAARLYVERYPAGPEAPLAKRLLAAPAGNVAIPRP